MFCLCIGLWPTVFHFLHYTLPTDLGCKFKKIVVIYVFVCLLVGVSAFVFVFFFANLQMVVNILSRVVQYGHRIPCFNYQTVSHNANFIACKCTSQATVDCHSIDYFISNTPMFWYQI